jgi:hypothetical protein
MGSGSASAAPTTNPPISGSFPAGQACTFQLDFSGRGGNFMTRQTNSIRTISGGTGSALTFTNAANGKTVSFPSNGVASIVTQPNQDGSFTEQLTGHNVVILMPTDITKGPSTTLIVGRVVINVGPKPLFPFDVLSVSGTQTDICALLT